MDSDDLSFKLKNSVRMQWSEPKLAAESCPQVELERDAMSVQLH